MMMSTKPILFSAIQPSGKLTIGNYISVIAHFSNLQKYYSCLYSIADLHAITTIKDAKTLNQSRLDTIAIYLASGIDPKNSILFMQSSVPEHCQLLWVLNCYTQFGELMRMTQFKVKSKRNSNDINTGLFNYPVLMSSDILLYQSNEVLIGKDQIQHLELTRNIAYRLNSLYGHIFNIPNIYIPNLNSSKIMALLNPLVKMSKSDINQNNTIFLLDSRETILKKIIRSKTDSENKVYYDMDNKPGISNLLNICSSFTGKNIIELESIFSNTSYQEFKYFVSNVVSNKLSDLQEKFYYFRNQKPYLEDIIKNGSYEASKIAQKTIHHVYNILGL